MKLKWLDKPVYGRCVCVIVVVWTAKFKIGMVAGLKWIEEGTKLVHAIVRKRRCVG